MIYLDIWLVDVWWYLQRGRSWYFCWKLSRIKTGEHRLTAQGVMTMSPAHDMKVPWTFPTSEEHVQATKLHMESNTIKSLDDDDDDDDDVIPNPVGTSTLKKRGIFLIHSKPHLTEHRWKVRAFHAMNIAPSLHFCTSSFNGVLFLHQNDWMKIGP